MKKPQSYLYLAVVNPADEIGVSNVKSGHTANSRFFCVQKSMATLWAGRVELRKQRQLLFTGTPIRTVPLSLIGVREVEKNHLKRGHAMTTPALAAPAQSPTVFQFKESHNVRIQVISSEPWFCLSDICETLSVDRTSRLLRDLDTKGMADCHIPTNGGNQSLKFVNEPNLYRIIFRSNKTEAREFQNWVFNEVLPAIRQTGSYSAEKFLPTIDIRSCLLDNLSKPVIPLPMHIQKALDQKAFALALEAHELCKEHLARRVAFTSEGGIPRNIDEEKAMAVIEKSDLGSALTHTFYSRLQFIQNTSHSAMIIATDFHNEIQRTLTGNPQKKLAN